MCLYEIIWILIGLFVIAGSSICDLKVRSVVISAQCEFSRGIRESYLPVCVHACIPLVHCEYVFSYFYYLQCTIALFVLPITSGELVSILNMFFE